MKKSIIYFLILLASVSFAQDAKYMKAMEKNIAIIDSAKDVSYWQEAANAFERIGTANSGEWLPLYYQAYCQVMIGMQEKENSFKDEHFDRAKNLTDKADAISQDNSEIYVLKSFIMGMMISIDPMTRGQKLGMESSMLIEKAIQLNKENPRAYFIKGTSLMYRPTQFGGGKEVAQPILESAVEKFSTFKPESSIMPHWGAERAKGMLEQCKKME